MTGDSETSDKLWMKELPVKHEQAVRHVFTCSQERLMLSVSNTVKVMDLMTEVQTHTLAGHTDRVSNHRLIVSFSNIVGKTLYLHTVGN